jgi:hypothetical protein
MSLRIDRVTIENVKGVEHLEMALGSLTILKGANGTGKSSVLDALSSVFDGGHDPSLIRLGADTARVAITLDNGTIIRKTITAKASKLDITTVDGLKVSKPAAFVEKLASGFSYDPIAFLQADPKKRAAFLLEAMPIFFSPEEIEAACDHKVSAALNIDRMNELRQGYYDKRREVNVAEREAQALVSSVRASLPPDDGEDWPAKALALIDRKTALSTELATIKGTIRQDADAAISAAVLKQQQAVEAARVVFEAAKAASAEEHRAAVADVERAASEATSAATAEINAELQTVSADLATAEEKRRQQDRSIEARRQLALVQERAATLNVESFRLTQKLESLDALKKAKLSEMPIPGIEIVDGKILVDGIELDQINTQQQYFIAFQIASLRQGDLGFMICDRVESLVGNEWEEFQQAAAASGFQVLVARSEADQALTVEEVA